MNKTRFEITTLEELMDYSAHSIQESLKKQKKSNAKLVLLYWDISYRDQLRKGYSGPIDRPIQYIGSFPGWSGRVWILYSEQPTNACNSYTRNSLIHTGTGGYGAYDIEKHVRGLIFDIINKQYLFHDIPVYPVSYDCKIYIDDIPGYKLQNLLNQESPQERHTCLYLSPSCRRELTKWACSASKTDLELIEEYSS